MSWWLEGLNPKGLSQGDIVSQVLSGTTDQPLKHLGKESMNKGPKRYWPEVDSFQPSKTDGRGLYVARGRVTFAIVVSHNCELDKSKQVLLAPIAELARVNDQKSKETILSQQRRAFLPLPNIPGLGTYYADFRVMGYSERNSILDANRQASMSDIGVLRLRTQIVAFFTRIDPDMLDVAIMGAIEKEKQ